MKYIASFDIGTTSIKGLLIQRDGEISGESTSEFKVSHKDNGYIEQDPNSWFQGMVEIANYWWNECFIKKENIAMVTFSGQMQDVIPIDENGEPLIDAILYSDNRAKAEAEELNEQLSDVFTVTGNSINSSSPFAKILWVKENEPETYRKAKSFLFNAKDFVQYKLTGNAHTDAVTGATTGLMDVRKRDWNYDWLDQMDILKDKIPQILKSDEVVGKVTLGAAAMTGFKEGTPILCGCGDAGATTVGAGTIQEGESYIYTGTTGWIATSSSRVEEKEYGIFNLPHLPENQFISIAPLLNVGNVHQWATQIFANAQNDFKQFEKMVEHSDPTASDVLFLPYLNGERFPVSDPNAKGLFFGITASTTKEQMCRAVIEGLSFSFRQTFEILIPNYQGEVTLIGGGAKSKVWCQTLSNILGRPIRTPKNSEFLPAIGAAAAAFLRNGWSDTYKEFVDNIIKDSGDEMYHPATELKPLYDIRYRKFMKLYPAVKDLF